MRTLLQSMPNVRCHRTTSRYLRLFLPMLLALTGLLFLLLSLPSITTTPVYALAETLLFSDSEQSLGNSDSTAVAMGDLDSDGDIDAFVANGLNSDQSNQVWLNDGIGHFNDSGQSLGHSTSSDVALGDLDGDGDLDAFVANTSITATTGQPNKVWLNDGTGHFTDSGQSLPPSASSDVALGDLDGDGDLDAFVSNGYFSENFPYVQGEADRVWLNDGTAHFTLSDQLPEEDSISTAVALGDVDGDGDLDAFVMGGIVKVSFPPLELDIQLNNKVWLNDGDGTFTDSGESLQIPVISKEVALGDLDEDGDLDAFVTFFEICLPIGSKDGCFGERPNQVWWNDGDGTFTDSEQRLGNSDSFMVALEDLDYDGDLDAFVANGYLSGLTQPDKANKIWLNDGTGTFTDSQSLGVLVSVGVALADVDGDGDLDGFVANIGNNKVWLNGSGHFYENSQSLGDSRSYAVALGDLDGDGDLDTLVGNANHQANNNKVWLNNGDGILSESQSLGNSSTRAVALGDLDEDDDLDAFVGNDDTNQVWLNNGHGVFTESNQSLEGLNTWDVALGDLDGDEDLDAFVGNRGINKVWLNDGDGQFTDSGQNLGDLRTYGVALGDLDEDGDLDVFVANNDAPNKVWLNNGNAQFTDSGQSLGNSLSFDVSLGDLDSDGDLDAFVASPGIQGSTIWNNDGRGYFTESGQGLGNSAARGGALGDIDGDGDLDIFMANESIAIGEPEPETFWLNDGAGHFSKSNQELGNGESQAVALGDLNGDGNLDVFVANGLEDSQVNEQANQVYLSKVGGPVRFQIAVEKPGSTADGNFYSTAEILLRGTIPITYTLFDPLRTTMGRIEVFYSMDGGDNWQNAVPTTDTITTNLATSPYPTTTATNTHLFTWDTFASGFFGQSENVVLRLVAYPQPEATGMTGSYDYTNSLAGPYLWPYASATTFPFRVRGTQVRVYSETIAADHEVANAYVYRQPLNQSSAELMANSSAGFTTNEQGFLQGRGRLDVGDQIVALLPITSTESYTLYHTSAAPTATGLDMFTVSALGVQELVVSADNPLILFDLDVSLEWDARNDERYLTQLESDLQRTSEILYDLTNGQLALGNIRVHQAKENWLDSHILIYATNNLRPNADLGGIVKAPISDTLSHTQGITVTDAYFPGQVRMSAIWNRFGDPTGEVNEDWPRTLAHELGHYLLFLPDNYLGLKDGLLTQMDCQGSAMTDAYREDYSEFLTEDKWTGDCLYTLAQYTTGRPDWETITTFYEMLNRSGSNTGPSTLPLNVTNVKVVEPETPPNTLNEPLFFYIRDENGNQLHLPFGQAQGYLFKTQGTTKLTDDMVIPLGSPTADFLRIRGAEPNDRLCIFDDSHEPGRLGCVEEISEDSINLSLHEVPDWEPQITVESVTSYTLAITVTQPISSGILYAQLLPAAHPTTIPNFSPVAAMNLVSDTDDTFTQTIELSYPIANGFVRLWISDTLPLQETITEFFLSGNWASGAGKYSWGPNHHRYGWGANRRHGWQAPVTARDGQVSIFKLDQILGDNPAYALQALSTPPNLPSWLTPVGQAYRFSAAEALTETLNIKYEYMQREVPGSDEGEGRLRIYYSPDEGESWQRLETNLDQRRNIASAQMPGEGIYALISTIELPPFVAEWNLLPYMVYETRTVATALASIDGYYTSVYHRDLSQSPEWRLYDQTVAKNHPEFSPLVNDLTHLEFGHSYFIYATDPITPYLAVDTSGAQRQANTLDPPATFYGWITPTASVNATVGMPITAWVNETQCGETTVQELNSQLAYKIQVSADGSCDTGHITFQVGDQLMAHKQAWDNSQAWYHPLSTNNQLYLPLIMN